MTDRSNAYKSRIIKGEQYFQSGDYGKALELFTSVLEEDPKNVEALNDAGVVSSQLGQPEQAIDRFEQVLALQPSNEDAFYNLLDLLLEEETPVEANKAFEKHQKTIQPSKEKSKFKEILASNNSTEKDEDRIDTIERLLDSGDFMQAKKMYVSRYKFQSEYYDSLFKIDSSNAYDFDFKYLIENKLASSGNFQKISNPTKTVAPIFIGGCGSSGTTLFAKMIGNHPEIALGEELAVFDHPQIFSKSIGELKQAYLEQGFTRPDFLTGQIFPLTTKFGPYFGLFYPNHGRLYHDVNTTCTLLRQANSITGFFNFFLTQFARDQGKNRWAEKTPNNIYTANNILEAYPDGKFIHIIRDGRDVIHSLVSRRNFDLQSAIVRWLSAVSVRDKIAFAERYLEIKYEDLVLDTEQVLHTVCEFLEIQYSDAMLKYHENNADGFLGYATSPVFQSSVGKWDDIEWETAKKSLVELSIATQLRKLGYN